MFDDDDDNPFTGLIGNQILGPRRSKRRQHQKSSPLAKPRANDDAYSPDTDQPPTKRRRQHSQSPSTFVVAERKPRALPWTVDVTKVTPPNPNPNTTMSTAESISGLGEQHSDALAWERRRQSTAKEVPEKIPSPVPDKIPTKKQAQPEEEIPTKNPTGFRSCPSLPRTPAKSRQEPVSSDFSPDTPVTVAQLEAEIDVMQDFYCDQDKIIYKLKAKLKEVQQKLSICCRERAFYKNLVYEANGMTGITDLP